MNQQNNSKVLILSILLAIVVTGVVVAGAMYYFQQNNLRELEEEIDELVDENQQSETSSGTSTQLAVNKPSSTSNNNTGSNIKKEESQPIDKVTKEEVIKTPDKKEETVKDPVKEETTLYTNARYGFSLELPKSWGQVTVTEKTPEIPEVEDSALTPIVPIYTFEFKFAQDANSKFNIDVFGIPNRLEGFHNRITLHQDNKYSISLVMMSRDPLVNNIIQDLIVPSFKKS